MLEALLLITACHNLPEDPQERRRFLKAHRQAIAEENRRWTKELVEVPKEHWADNSRLESRIGVWRSKEFIVQIFQDGDYTRISVNRTCLLADGHFKDDITWDTMQAIKASIGYAGFWAAELFPPDDQLVNVANIRHMWILNEIPPYGWQVKHAQSEEERSR